MSVRTPVDIIEVPLSKSTGFLGFETAVFNALGDAIVPNRPGENLSFFLYQGGCRLLDNTNDCTIACQDASLATRNIFTIQNCMVYPVILSLLASSKLSVPAMALAKSYGIVTTVDTTVTTAIYQTLTACFEEVCKNCSSNHFSKHLDWTEAFQIEGPIQPPDICSSIDSSIHPDIGGIGTFISYFMQVGIALATWTVLRFFDTWTRNFIFCFTFPFGPSRAKRIAIARQQKLKSSRQHAVLKTALVEFHKAQCYFMLAFQIAAMIVLKAGFRALESKSYQQLKNNIDLVGGISVNGFLPITFVLFCLHTEGMKSWHAFILSTCTVTASIVTFFTVSKFKATPNDVRGSTDFKSCGGNESPTKYCLGASSILDNGTFLDDFSFHYMTSMNHGVGGGSILLFSLVVLLLLLIDQCELSHRRGDDGREKRVNSYICLKMWIKDWPIWSRTKSLAFLKWIWLDTPERAIRFGTAILLLIIEIYYLFLFFGFFFYLFETFDFGSNYFSDSPASSWSFGQIIAVTIWAPCIVEYIYLLLRGMRKGSQYRIPKPYRMVKDGER